MEADFHGLSVDTATSVVGATVAALSWFQVITGIESVIIGGLTIVLIIMRIWKHF